MDELKTKIYRIGSAAGFSMSDNPDGADYDVNTMDSKGSWYYISHRIARMRNRMIMMTVQWFRFITMMRMIGMI